MRGLARFNTLNAKPSFVPLGSKQKYPCSGLHAGVLKIVEAFGADRCVWGSDFPSELWTPGISYAQHLQIFLGDIPLGEPARQQILGLTARKLWFPER